MLLIHTEQDCRTATSKPLHWQCTLLSSPLYTCGQEQEQRTGETYAQGKKQCFIGREIYKKRVAQVLISNHTEAFFVLNIDAQTYNLLANRWPLVCPSFPLSVCLFIRSLRLPSVNEGDHCLLQSRSLVYIYRCLTCCHLCKSWSGSRRPSVLNDLRHRLARNKKIICSRQSQDMCTVWKYSVLTANTPHILSIRMHIEKQT